MTAPCYAAWNRSPYSIFARGESQTLLLTIDPQCRGSRAEALGHRYSLPIAKVRADLIRPPRNDEGRPQAPPIFYAVELQPPLQYAAQACMTGRRCSISADRA